jgi:hypothetical protein
MASSTSAKVLFAALLLSESAQCANIIRSEAEGVSAKLTSNGVLSVIKGDTKPSDKARWTDPCEHFDYALGKENTDWTIAVPCDTVIPGCEYIDKDDKDQECGAGKSKAIHDIEECKNAAAQFGITTHDAFVYEQQDTKPKGCYMQKCSETTTEMCMFYNDIGDTPTAVQGATQSYQICYREKYSLAPKLTGVAGSTPACPGGYAVIMDEPSCEKAASCIGDEVEPNPKKVPDADFDDYPEGCFVHSDGYVQFNDRPEGGTAAPQTPTGKPICHVEHHYQSPGEKIGAAAVTSSTPAPTSAA